MTAAYHERFLDDGFFLGDGQSIMNAFSTSHGLGNLNGESYLAYPRGSTESQTMRPETASTMVPELGKVRCYWAILIAPYLHFVYLDPVLRSHLGKQARSMIGTRVCDWIHHDEVKKAREDLTNFVQSKTVFGTVTRCRYTRLSQMRRHLGDEHFVAPNSLDMVSYDSHWMPLELVMNWIGDNLVLCFFHAVLDQDPELDSIEGPGASDWTNWCGVWGGDLFKKTEMDILKANIDYVKAGKLPRIPGLSNCSYEPYGVVEEDEEEIPVNVFQIIRPDSWEILLSWPPARPFPSPDNVSRTNPLRSSQQPWDHPGNVGANYDPTDFSRLVKEVCARTNTSRTVQVESTVKNAKTSCTRRFRARHILSTDSLIRSIESVVIPYGALTFACFRMANIKAQTPIPSEAYSHSQSPSVASRSSMSNGTPLSQSQSPLNGESAKPVLGNRGNLTENDLLGGTNRFAFNHQLVNNVALPINPFLNDQMSHAALAQYNMLFPGDHNDLALSVPNYSQANYYHAPLPTPASISMAQQQLAQMGTHFPQLHNANYYQYQHQHPPYGFGDPSGLAHEMPIKRCSACGTGNSPEWRRGPTGERDLCNACGLRFSRSQAREMRKTGGSSQDLGL